MAFPLKRLAEPTREPVLLTDMKQHLNIDAGFTDDDLLIGSLISAARQDAENFLGQALVPQPWIFALDYFPTERLADSAPSRADFDAAGHYAYNGWRAGATQIIALPQPPLLSVDSVQYIDPNGAIQTLPSSAYQVDALSEPGRIAPAVGSTWPSTAQALNAVQIRFTSGRVSTISLEPVLVPASPGPYTAALRQAAYFYQLTALTDQNGVTVPTSDYALSPSGVFTFLASRAGQTLYATYQAMAIPPSVVMAIKLRAAAYYANREEFLQGVSTPAPDWFGRMLTTAGRSNIFGYAGR